MSAHRPRVRVSLPHLSGAEALVLVDVLERLTTSLWRVHGDAMASILRRDPALIAPDDDPDDHELLLADDDLSDDEIPF